MTTQNQILKLISNTKFRLTNLGYKSGKYYYFLLRNLSSENKECKNYYIFKDLYELLQSYIKVINNKPTFIYEGEIRNIIEILLITKDEVKTYNGRKVNYYVWINSECGEGVIYCNYKNCNLKKFDMSKLMTQKEYFEKRKAEYKEKFTIKRYELKLFEDYPIQHFSRITQKGETQYIMKLTDDITRYDFHSKKEEKAKLLMNRQYYINKACFKMGLRFTFNEESETSSSSVEKLKCIFDNTKYDANLRLTIWEDYDERVEKTGKDLKQYLDLTINIKGRERKFRFYVNDYKDLKSDRVYHFYDILFINSKKVLGYNSYNCDRNYYDISKYRNDILELIDPTVKEKILKEEESGKDLYIYTNVIEKDASGNIRNCCLRIYNAFYYLDDEIETQYLKGQTPYYLYISKFKKIIEDEDELEEEAQ